MSFLPLLLLIVAGAFVFHVLVARSYDVRFRCRRGSVLIDGRLAQGKLATVSRFILELAGDRRVTVSYAYPRRGQLSRVRISGELTEGERQQIRNFLQAEI